jgi:hypothetical protein
VCALSWQYQVRVYSVPIEESCCMFTSLRPLFLRTTVQKLNNGCRFAFEVGFFILKLIIFRNFWRSLCSLEERSQWICPEFFFA